MADTTDLSELAATHPRTATMAASAGGTLLWYALPDVVRSRGLRALLKMGIAAGGAWAVIRSGAPCSGGDAPRGSEGIGELRSAVRENPTAAAVAAGLAVGGVWASIRCEQWLFHRGERRRAEGRFAPHLRQALPLALLVAAGELLDPHTGAGTRD
jgi:hypothetical protein